MTHPDKAYKGVVVPAVTPLTSSHTLDEAAVDRMLTYFRKNQVSAFILGTTGEAPSLPYAVKQAYIKAAGKTKAAGDTIYAGISSNCLEESIALAQLSFASGMDVVVATLPNYYALSPVQMKQYFEQLAANVQGPLIIYNIPATTHMSIPLDVVEALSHHPNIVGLKDSERNEERLQQALKLWKNRSDFSYFAGWAAQSANSLLNGGDGIIPSTGNFAAGLYHQLYQAALQGNQDKAQLLQQQSDALGNVYQSGRLLGESLWALKVLMKQQGLCETYIMPPLREGTEEEARKVLSEYKNA
jgi:dihydrodipicolinate synthase/N-acetylneuraminate lyase